MTDPTTTTGPQPADRYTQVLAIVSAWYSRANSGHAADAGDLAWDLEQAGYLLPAEDDAEPEAARRRLADLLAGRGTPRHSQLTLGEVLELLTTARIGFSPAGTDDPADLARTRAELRTALRSGVKGTHADGRIDHLIDQHQAALKRKFARRLAAVLIDPEVPS